MNLPWPGLFTIEIQIANRQVYDGVVTVVEPVARARKIRSRAFRQLQYIAKELLLPIQQFGGCLDIDVV